MRHFFALSLIVWPLTLAGASAAQDRAGEDCASPVSLSAPLDGALQPAERVENYRIVLQTCRRAGEGEVIATRTLRVDGEDFFLAVDPETLSTRLQRAACWTCADTGAAALAGARFIRSVETLSESPGKTLAEGASWLENAGLVSGRGGGAFLTGDLCPSKKPLDRGFLKSLEEKGAATPIALAVSGLWIERHAQDFLWLRREMAEGRLAISFVNHSYHHPYRPGVADGRNFLLVPGVDMQSEITGVERLLIANGEVPSVFFRFPGLISDRALMEEVRAAHLIPLGAAAWLALAPSARPGAIVLVHPNGNEPFGLDVFARLRRSGSLPRPLRPIEEAP